MGESDVQDGAGSSRRAGRAAFDLYVSKLHPPATRPGMIRRSLLIKQLADGDDCPVVSVVAPPGYGKTTLLSQWAEVSAKAFAWVSVDQGDNDPKVLLTYVAEALDAVEPIDARVFEALASPVSSVPGWDLLCGRCRRRWCWCWTMCTCWITGNAWPRCRCWPIMCRPVPGWC